VPFKLVIAADKARDKRPRLVHRLTRDRRRRNKELPDARADAKRQSRGEDRFSSNDATARKRLALAGLGVAILPAFVVKGELDDGRLAELHREEKFRFDLLLVARAGRILPRACGCSSTR